jgi:FAD/FMN-containing dehydrogenase
MPDTALPATDRLLDAIRAIVGASGLLTDPSDTASYAEDWRKLYRGRTRAVIRPANTQELAKVVALCAAAGTPIVPQGGNTSMVGGAVPAEDGSELVLSTARLNRIRDIDPVDLTLTLDAGVTLKAAQIAAADAGCLLPLSISSEGSAQIGGVLAVNAGGNNTVRYGNARDLVLGLEVVLLERPASLAQGQHRVLPAPAVLRLRGLVGRHHRRRAETGTPASGRGGRFVRGCLAGGRTVSVRSFPGPRSGRDQRIRVYVRSRHGLRAQAYRGRCFATRRPRARLCAGRTRDPAA